MAARIAIALLKNAKARAALLSAALLIVLSPVLAAVALTSFIAQQAESSCGTPSSIAAGAGPVSRGLYAQPLALQSGRWYEVGATAYGNPASPKDAAQGSIPDPGQSDLTTHPDSFAELSLLNTNPAITGGSLTFADADALGNLPYLTGLHVAHNGRQILLYKRDTGYGQGPGQFIENGQPYRLDVWWQPARELEITKTPVEIQLAPPTGAAETLGVILPPTEPSHIEPASSSETCTGPQETGSAPLPLTAGSETKILPSGLAAAGEEAPAQVKAMVAAGNRLFNSSYLYGGGHGTPLSTLQPAYDCSSTVSYVLHAGGVFGDYAEDSGELESYGAPGPGRYVSIYANPAHTFIYVAGLRLDTVEDPAYDTGPNSGKPGPKWRVSPTVPDWSTWTVRHPPGL